MLATKERQVTALRQNGECYVVMWRVDNVQTAYHTIGRWASDPDLSLSWLQAGFLIQAIADWRQKVMEGKAR